MNSRLVIGCSIIASAAFFVLGSLTAVHGQPQPQMVAHALCSQTAAESKVVDAQGGLAKPTTRAEFDKYIGLGFSPTAVTTQNQILMTKVVFTCR